MEIFKVKVLDFDTEMIKKSEICLVVKFLFSLSPGNDLSESPECIEETIWKF